MPSRLELYCSGYQTINDLPKQSADCSKTPTRDSNAYRPNPKYIPPASENKDDVILTIREYNDLLARIYYLEHKNEYLHNVNKHLGQEIESLQKQLISKKLHKVRCLCKLRGKC